MEPRVIVPRALKYLIAIAEHGNYTRAAEALHVSQPALSQQIIQLEEMLQSHLVDRSGRAIRLTQAGETYLQHARRACGELAAGVQALHELEELNCGSLRIGWTPITDYLTCGFLARFGRRYPGITLHTFVMPQDDIQRAVAEAEVDTGVVYSEPPRSEATGEIDRQLLFEEPLCFAVGQTHPRFGQAQAQALSAEQLGRESLVLLNTGFELRHIIDRYCADHAVSPRVAVETDSLTVVLELVRQGLLATVLPRSIAGSQRGLFAIGLSPEMPRNAVTVICRRGGYKSAACNAFREFVLESVADGVSSAAT
jgi:LysR family cyn operon transcriptional activator